MYLETSDVLEALGAAFIVYVVGMALLEAEPSNTDGDRPDWATLTDLDLDALADGETRRVRTADGDTLRLEAVDGEEVDVSE
ncbi:hypothetical protein VB773_01475 [Haloarculaceae archaeon H-GB2-1]|nr:hypothetical protein [Haloarculaceae archaeon H-GB1-1]MEA5406384.1 hypothetical protein [Haloarculaceae archaeon H-GB2-1]